MDNEKKIKVVDQPTVSTSETLAQDKLGQLIQLNEVQSKRLKKFLKKNLDAWETDTADLHDNLVADNDLVENVIEDTGWPYEGAPNIHLPVTSIYMKIYKSVEKRSILGAGNIWTTRLEPDVYGTPLEQIAPHVSEMMNYKALNEWNIAEKLEDVFAPTNRDGLGILKVPYVEETETQRDILLFESVDEFLAKFPTAEEAGMEKKEYEAILQKIKNEGGPDTPIEVPIEFEKVVYSGPKAKVVELIDFVTFPANCQDLSAEHCKGYGELFTLRKGAIKAKGKTGTWDKEAVKRVVNARSKPEQNDLRKAQDEIEGLGITETDGTRFLEITIRFDLDKDGKERKLLVTYAPEEEEIMACMDYPYRVDFYALFRIGKRTNRLIGESIPAQARDLNELMDRQITQRVLSREISTVPSFKGKKSAKGDFDPEAQENRWRPGVIFWLEDPEAFDQFKIQPTDLGESMQEEKNAMSMLDLSLGSSASLMSGQAAVSDPSAPGNKTAMMLSQSNMRMDDPLSTLRSGVDQLGDICLSHLYQFGPPVISFVADQAEGQTQKTLQKKFLRSGFKMAMAGMTVVDNPDAEMARWLGLGAQLMKLEPTFAANPEARTTLWGMALSAGRVPNRDKLLPSPQVLKQQQMEMIIEAQKALAMQNAVQGAVAEKERVDQRFKDVREGLARRALVEKVVEQAAGKNGMNGENGNAPTNQ